MASSFFGVATKYLLLSGLLSLQCICTQASEANPPPDEFQCPPASGEKQIAYTEDAIRKKSCDFLSIDHDKDACRLDEIGPIGKVGDCEYFGTTYITGDEQITASAIFARPVSSNADAYYFLTVNDARIDTHKMPGISFSPDGPILSMFAYNGNAMTNDSNYYHWHNGVWHLLKNTADLANALPKPDDPSLCPLVSTAWPDFGTMTFDETFYTKYGDRERQDCLNKTRIISFGIKDNKFVMKNATWK